MVATIAAGLWEKRRTSVSGRSEWADICVVCGAEGRGGAAAEVLEAKKGSSGVEQEQS